MTAVPTGAGLSDRSREYLEELLHRDEEWALDYATGEDLRRWAREIDLLRSEAGLPSVERFVETVDAVVRTEVMTFEESLVRDGRLVREEVADR